MDLHQLRCFLALCEEMNFGRAAERMHMTQPPFSRQIKLLEEKLGVDLFERSTRNVRLTAAGEILSPQIKRSVEIADGLALTALRVAKGELGNLRVGFTSGASYELLPRVVALARACLPDVALRLEERGTYHQIDAIHDNKLDIGIIRYPRSSRGLRIVRASREKLKVALPGSHRLSNTPGPIKLSALQDEDFILYTPESNEYLYSITTALMASAGIVPKNVQHIRSIHTMLPLVALSSGIAIVPESAARMLLDNVCIRDIEISSAPITADLYIAYRPDITNPAALRLLSAWNADHGEE